MDEPDVPRLRAALPVILAAGAFAAATLLGLRLRHPFLGALAGYSAQAYLALFAFGPSKPRLRGVLDLRSA